MNLPLTPLRFLRYAREQFPQKTAVVCKDNRFTYAQFAERAGRLARGLIAASAQRGDRVAFIATNCHRLLEGYYGVVEAGGVLVPLNIRLGAKELAYILNDAQARFLFIETQFAQAIEPLLQEVPSIKAVVLLDGAAASNGLAHYSYEELILNSPVYQCDLNDIDENAVAEIFYTSGTTAADSKGVMLTHRNVYLHALSVILAFQTSKATAGQPSCQTVQLHTIPLFHSNGWGAAHSVTVVGGTHVMIQRFNPSEIFRLIEREKVTCLGVVPTMAAAMVHAPMRAKYDLSSLRTMMVGGAASSAALVREVEETLGCACMGGYGLTECSPVLAMSPSKGNREWQGEQRYAHQAKTGFAVPGVEIRVIDPEGHEVPHDGKTPGEVVARGDGIMQGYWRMPEATKAAFEGGWFHTGDLATVDEDNYLLIVGRKKDIIISGGENISSVEVEQTIAAHPSVQEVAVIPVPDEKWGEVPKALVVLKSGAEASEAELLEFCRDHLAGYKVPRSVEFIDRLPRTETGKLLKMELRKKYWPAKAIAS